MIRPLIATVSVAVALSLAPATDVMAQKANPY